MTRWDQMPCDLARRIAWVERQATRLCVAATVIEALLRRSYTPEQIERMDCGEVKARLGGRHARVDKIDRVVIRTAQSGGHEL